MLFSFKISFFLATFVLENLSAFQTFQQEELNFIISNKTLVELDDVAKAAYKLSQDPDDIRFLLYSNRSNPTQGKHLTIANFTSICDSGFVPNLTTVVLIHGFWTGIKAMPATIAKAYLTSNKSQNIIVVDWNRLSSTIPRYLKYKIPSYKKVVLLNIPTVVTKVAEFIQFLIDNQLTTLKQLHLIGYSLGAHICGGVGHLLQMRYGSPPFRITGLDPASPLFEVFTRQRSLTKSDAEFVDVYHTSAGTTGIKKSIGHADFFPNGGQLQPGCFLSFIKCSHNFSYKFYAASIIRNFTACKCEPMFHYKLFSSKKRCGGKCKQQVLAGEPCPSTARGQFYFTTLADPFKE